MIERKSPCKVGYELRVAREFLKWYVSSGKIIKSTTAWDIFCAKVKEDKIRIR